MNVPLEAALRILYSSSPLYCIAQSKRPKLRNSISYQYRDPWKVKKYLNPDWHWDSLLSPSSLEINSPKYCATNCPWLISEFATTPRPKNQNAHIRVTYIAHAVWSEVTAYMYMTISQELKCKILASDRRHPFQNTVNSNGWPRRYCWLSSFLASLECKYLSCYVIHTDKILHGLSEQKTSAVADKPNDMRLGRTLKNTVPVNWRGNSS